MKSSGFTIAIFIIWALSVLSLTARALPEDELLETADAPGIAESAPLAGQVDSELAQEIRSLESVYRLNSGALDSSEVGVLSERPRRFSVKSVHRTSSSHRSILSSGQK